MNNKALNTIKKYSMLNKGDRVIASVSGGADSMALLCLLLEIKEEYNLSITVCHINHMLRGDEAIRDEEFVSSFCKKKSLDFRLLRCDVLSLSKEKGIGFEECGREVRYGFLSQTAKSLSGAKIMTAHTLSDCAETLIFNIARGTSPTGVSSINPVRDNIMRPLIECTREEIEAYLLRKGVSYVTDSTNSDTEYTRNYIRHEIIPRFKRLNPSFEQSVLNLTSISREQSDYILACAKKEMEQISSDKKIDRIKFLDLHPAIKSGIISLIFRENNIEFSKKKCDEILSKIKGEAFKISLNSNLFLEGNENSFFVSENSKPVITNFNIPVILGEHPLDEFKKIKFSLISYEKYLQIKENFPNLLKNCINYDIIDNSFCVRPRKEGDFITLYKRNVTKTLKKLFNESKIDKNKRGIIPVLASGSQVFWAEGVAVSAEAAIGSSTKRILYIEIL